ncbi:hypothetical protein POG22_00505 [Geitlerinema sp. CS-897]|nr:hypothetical protein [Geitlerinema sp. CS-897]
MTNALPPERLQELAAGYVLGDLSSEEAECFQAYLQQDPQLAVEVARLYEVLGVMPYGLPNAPPPPRLRNNILAAATSEPPAENPIAAEPSEDPARPEPKIAPFPESPRCFRRRWGGWQVWTSGIAAVAAVALAADNFRLRQNLQDAEVELAWERADFGALVMPSEAVLANNWDGLEQLADDHMDAMSRKQGPMDFNSSDLAAIIDRFDRQFEFDDTTPTIARRDVRLMGGSLCEFGKIPGLRYTYTTDDNHTISFYQIDTRTDRLSLPKTGSGKLYISQPGKPRIVLWADNTYIYAIVAELPPEELKDLSYNVVMQ